MTDQVPPAQWYRRYGLDLLSDAAFGRPVNEPDPPAPDLRIHRFIELPDPVTDVSVGEVLVRVDDGVSANYMAVREADGYRLHFHGLADYVLDSSLSNLECHPHPDVSSELVDLVLQASVLALILTLRGHLVLHASAIATADRITAIAGPSGAGKSTTAAWLCSAGAELVADDLLRIDDPDHVYGTGPGPELRLRPMARKLADAFPVTADRHETADRRLAIAPPEAASAEGPLAAIILPTLVDDDRDVAVEPVTGPAAVMGLAAATRTPGWLSPELQESYFAKVVELVETVPILRVQVPWGRPSGRADASQLLRQLVDLPRR